MMEGMSLNELALLSEIPISQIHYYEKEGLIRTSRELEGKKLYGADDFYRLMHIALLEKLGLTAADMSLCMKDFKDKDEALFIDAAICRIEDQIKHLERLRIKVSAACLQAKK